MIDARVARLERLVAMLCVRFGLDEGVDGLDVGDLRGRVRADLRQLVAEQQASPVETRTAA